MHVTTEHFDLIIIGSGSGNSLVTPDFEGKRVAIVEKGVFGGTCLNVGCIPTKMFVYAAEVANSIRSASKYGIDATIDQVRWDDIRDRVFGRIDPISAGGKDYRVNGPGTTAYLGQATFVAERTLEISGLPDGEVKTISGDQVVIATGAHAVVPDAITASGVKYETSDTVMRLPTLPKSMIILGGGFIAAEFAHVFSALGVKVSVVNRSRRLLRELDEQISDAFTDSATQAWDVRLGAVCTTAQTTQAGVKIELNGDEIVEGEVLLVATGRAPNTANLGLAAAGVASHEDGRVVVDKYGRSTASGVWALGDVSSEYQLKHVANHEARVVAHNLSHPHDLIPFNHNAVPAAVFTHPQIATVGLTEAQARGAGYEVTIKVQAFGDTAYGWAMEDTTSFIKLIADKKSRMLLGAHLIGPDSSSLIQPILQAMSFGQRADELARGQYWIHPALSEVVENALLGLEFDAN